MIIQSKIRECTADRRFKERPLTGIHKVIIHRSGIGKDALSMALAYRFNKAYAVVTGGQPPYHFVILKDGTIEQALGYNIVGAHCKGENTTSIGIACLGDFRLEPPTPAQWASATWLVEKMMKDFGVNPSEVKGHDEFPGVRAYKECPGDKFVMADFRKALFHSFV